MKKPLTLLVLIGAAIATAAYLARRRGQDLGEFAGEWAERAKEAASSTADTVTDTLGDTKDSLEATAIDLRDDVKPAPTS